MLNNPDFKPWHVLTPALGSAPYLVEIVNDALSSRGLFFGHVYAMFRVGLFHLEKIEARIWVRASKSTRLVVSALNPLSSTETPKMETKSLHHALDGYRVAYFVLRFKRRLNLRRHRCGALQHPIPA